MLDGSEGLDTHSLLLSLAGLVDDELLGWTRELAAVGEADYALDLVIAAIAADRVRLPEQVHAALSATRRGRDAVALPEPDPAPAMPHRFLADPAGAGYPAAVAEAFPVDTLRTLPGRMLRGCQLWLTWRLTPTGSAPGPVPHPVLLVETADDGGADLLAYQVADLLWQAGVFASVEVFGSDTRLTDYHRAALEAAGELDLTGGPADTGATPRVEPATPPRGTPAARDSGRRDALRPVERVIAARSAQRPGAEHVMPFERATGDADGRGRFDAFDDGGPREQRRAPGAAPGGRPRAESGPSRPGGMPGEWQPGADPVGPPPERRAGRGRPAGGDHRNGGHAPNGGPGPGGAGGPGPGGPGGPGNGIAGTQGTPPVPPGPPPMGPVNQPTGRQPIKQAGPPPPPPNRPPLRQVDEELPDGLSDVEQRLLRQLHEELAARDEDSGLPPADQPPQRMFRNTNGGGRGPRRPMGPPPDHAG